MLLLLLKVTLSKKVKTMSYVILQFLFCSSCTLFLMPSVVFLDHMLTVHLLLYLPQVCVLFNYCFFEILKIFLWPNTTFVFRKLYGSTWWESIMHLKIKGRCVYWAKICRTLAFQRGGFILKHMYIFKLYNDCVKFLKCFKIISLNMFSLPQS